MIIAAFSKCPARLIRRHRHDDVVRVFRSNLPAAPLGSLMRFPLWIESALDSLEANAVTHRGKIAVRQDHFEVPGRLTSGVPGLL